MVILLTAPGILPETVSVSFLRIFFLYVWRNCFDHCGCSQVDILVPLSRHKLIPVCGYWKVLRANELVSKSYRCTGGCSLLVLLHYRCQRHRCLWGSGRPRTLVWGRGCGTLVNVGIPQLHRWGCGLHAQHYIEGKGILIFQHLRGHPMIPQHWLTDWLTDTHTHTPHHTTPHTHTHTQPTQTHNLHNHTTTHVFIYTCTQTNMVYM